MSDESPCRYEAGIVVILNNSGDLTSLENIVPSDKPFLQKLTRDGFHYRLEKIDGKNWARVYTDRPVGTAIK